MSVELQIETVSTCSARCSFCVYPSVASTRGGQTMGMGLFEKIIDEAVTIPLITRYVLHGLGEPTLDKLLAERMHYIRERCETPIEIYTHGLHLTPKLFEKLKKYGLTSLVVSLNAVRADQHQQIMGLVGSFNRVCENIDYVIKNRDNVNLEVHAVLNEPTFSKEDMAAFEERWKPYGHVIQELNWAGDNRTTFTFDPNDACGRALGQMYVMVDGRVSMCCLDPTGKTIFGDLKTQGIREIYNSERYVLFRELHSSNKAGVFKQCHGCTRT